MVDDAVAVSLVRIIVGPFRFPTKFGGDRSFEASCPALETSRKLTVALSGVASQAEKAAGDLGKLYLEVVNMFSRERSGQRRGQPCCGTLQGPPQKTAGLLTQADTLRLP